MTRKNYEAAAAIVRETPENPYTVQEAFVTLFTNDNPRFDAARFRAACRQAK